MRGTWLATAAMSNLYSRGNLRLPGRRKYRVTRSDAFIWLEVGLVLLEEHDILSTGHV